MRLRHTLRNYLSPPRLNLGSTPELAIATHLTLQEQVRLECEAMARYALQHGLNVQPDLTARLLAVASSSKDGDADNAQRVELAAVHHKLVQLVAPATPQGITLLDQDHLRSQRFNWLGPVPLIRMLTLTAVGFLAAVVLTALSGDVSSSNIARGLLDSSGSVLLLNMLFLLCCAGLGAAYATLFHAHRYIANCTYDPKYDASYGARLILGVIAGLILAEMLPAQLFAEGGMHNFGKPALAMLGGFSATAVHRLLQRLVETLETLVRGDGTRQYRAALETQQAQAASERVQSRSETAAQLIRLQQSLDADLPAAEVRNRLAEITRAMLVAQGNEGSAVPAKGNEESRS